MERCERNYARARCARLTMLFVAFSPLLAAFSLQSLGQAPIYERSALPLLKKYCWPCHTGASAPMDLRLGHFPDEKSVLANRAVFEKIAQRVKTGTMPPPGAAAPSPKERETLLGAIQATFAKAPPPPLDPGRPTLRRLNRAEYDNTIRDLFGLDLKLSADFPSDDVGHGFDNIGDVLSLSPLLLEKYLGAAEAVANAAIKLPDLRTRVFDAANLATDDGRIEDANAVVLFTNGAVWAEPNLDKPGLYKMRVVAWAQQAGPEPAKMAIRIGDRQSAVVEVHAEQGRPQPYELPPVELPAGKHRFAAAFVNDYYNPNVSNPRNRDRNLFVQSIEVTGPLGPQTGLPESHLRIMIATPDAGDPLPAARKILGAFLPRAFRRPVKPDEVERFIQFVKIAEQEGQPFEQGIRLAVQAALVSPHFLFRVELDPAMPERTTAIRGTRSPAATSRPVSPYELASRLSYFLWSSMPDDELFRLAESGVLVRPETLSAQVARMLKSPKARALTENFAAQWLTLRKLDAASPDPELFPEWNEPLRKAMRTETEMFFEHVVRNDLPVTEFLGARYTFVNQALAKLYGLPPPQNDAGGFARVELPGPRAGILTHASILTLTSNPNRTSPVKRGKWILENILGAPPPPPPPGLDTLAEGDAKVPTKTIKERMAAHRAKPDCAVCHARMDPLGFALENFDAVGKWRDNDGPFPIDPSDTLPNGTRLSGPTSLRAYLAKRKDEFVRTLAERLLTYAIGRGVTTNDNRALDRITQSCKEKGYRFSALVQAVATSEPFVRRTLEGK